MAKQIDQLFNRVKTGLFLILALLSSIQVYAEEDKPGNRMDIDDVQELIKKSKELSKDGQHEKAYLQAQLAAKEALSINRKDYQVIAIHQGIKAVINNDAATKKDVEQAFADLKLAEEILDEIQINGLQMENKLLRIRLNRAMGDAVSLSVDKEELQSGSEMLDIKDIKSQLEKMTKKSDADLQREREYLLRRLEAQNRELSAMTSEQLKQEVINLRQASLIDSMNISMVLDSVRLAQSEMLIREKSFELTAAENQLKLEKSRRNQLIAIAGIFVLIALIILIQYFNSRKFNRTLKIKNAQIEAEKERSDKLLLNILPADIASELKANGEVAARSFDEVTVLFTDFKDFTKTSENLSATELVEELNICFKAFDEITSRYNIEKIKTIGDAYMAASGFSGKETAGPHGVIMAALEMQAFVQRRMLENKQMGKDAFEMRIGIHTGPIVAGVVGVKKFQYDIWGDTVNTAARMESTCEIGKVNISQDTYVRVKQFSDLSFTDRGMVEVKGKGQMPMYFADRKI